MKFEADEKNNVSLPPCASERYFLKSNKEVRQIWGVYLDDEIATNMGVYLTSCHEIV